MLQVCLPEMRQRLEKAKNEGYLEVFVVGIINNIWGGKKRVSSPLYMIADNTSMWQDYKEVSKQINDSRVKSIKAVNELNKKIKIKEESEAAKLLWRVSQSNIYTVKKEEGCHSRVITRRIKPIINDIRRKLDE